MNLDTEALSGHQAEESKRPLHPIVLGALNVSNKTLYWKQQERNIKSHVKESPLQEEIIQPNFKRSAWNDVFQVLKGNKYQTRIPYLAKLYQLRGK